MESEILGSVVTNLNNSSVSHIPRLPRDAKTKQKPLSIDYVSYLEHLQLKLESLESSCKYSK